MRVPGVLLLSLCCVPAAFADQPAPAADAPKVDEPAPPPKPKVEPFVGVAGWNGDHFSIQSLDGRFTFQPYGYVQGDYRIYTGDGVPPNTFTLRRARLGVQGKFDQYYEYAFLADFVDTTSHLLRDAYVNVRYIPEVQLTVGQMVEPFGQEVATVGVTNIDFVERGLTSLLYPSAVGAFHSPGAMLHGDIAKGTVSYWLGAFNGKGPTAANTTSEPELIGRLRIYPFKASSSDLLKGIAIGGAFGHGRSSALSNELSFSGSVPEGAFSFFPQLAINGPILRYNGEGTFIAGPFALRGEYDELHQKRQALGNGFSDLPEVVARGFYISATFLLAIGISKALFGCSGEAGARSRRCSTSTWTRAGCCAGIDGDFDAVLSTTRASLARDPHWRRRAARAALIPASISFAESLSRPRSFECSWISRSARKTRPRGEGDASNAVRRAKARS